MRKRIISLILAVILVLSATASANWESFRGSAGNMAITTAPVPTDPAKAEEKWSTKESLKSGTGWNVTNPAPMLLVDGKLITTSGANLLEVDTETGEILRTGEMAAANGTLGNSAPAYGQGMIFVPLQDGTVQAFDAETFTAVWRSESLGKQCTTGLVYDNGYVFGCTGNSSPGKVFCLQAADEDTETCQEKQAVWAIYSEDDDKGSYWSTPIVTETAVVYGTDSGFLCSRSRTDGTLLSRLELPGGKQRSGIALYEGRVYGGTSTGYLFSAALAADGSLSDLKAEKYEAVSSITSTPVIYNGVVYYGGSKMVVAADAATLKTLRTSGDTGFAQPKAGGAVQSSLLLHPGQDAVYLYATQNCKPGGLYLVKDTGTEMTASALHTPAEEKQEYCLVSPICDEKGTIYYRNDSGYLFAVGAVEEPPKEPEQGLPVTPPVQPATISVSVEVKNHLGAALFPRQTMTAAAPATPYDLLMRTGLPVITVTTEFGIYVQAVAGLAEKSMGEGSGWIYEVNGVSPSVGASNYTLQSGDVLCWRFIAPAAPVTPVTPSAPVQQEPEKEPEKEPAALPFTDAQGHWGEEAIRFVTENGLMQGVSAEQFLPEAALTRGMLATVLYRMAGSAGIPEGNAADVEKDAWYAPGMFWAQQQGILQGNGDGRLLPRQDITRQELAVMLWRYDGCGFGKDTLSAFPDGGDTAVWARKALAWALEKGILTGRADGTLDPCGKATRAEAAAMLMRFMEARA